MVVMRSIGIVAVVSSILFDGCLLLLRCSDDDGYCREC